MEKVEKEPPLEHYGELAARESIDLQVGKAGDLAHFCKIPESENHQVDEIYYCPCGRAWQRWM